ncbi:MAG: phosphonate transport system substrate-binding protein [Candidatus Azotimanducaceae bacterium]|jgi:phosphonate transport system substrate-binding protein
MIFSQTGRMPKFPYLIQSGLKLITATLLLSVIVACEKTNESKYTPEFSSTNPDTTVEYIFGVHPLHNPQRLFKVFGPMMQYLSDNIEDVSFRLEASRSYAAYDKKLYAKRFHFSLPNPFQTINAIDKGYRVFAKMGDDENFRGIILVRKDSGITSVTDLKGKAVSYPAPTALAATMMPQYFLQANGIDVMSELDNRYVGSQESSIMNVFLGHTAAASTWPAPWLELSQSRPELAEQLTVIWETEPLLNNGLVVLPSVPQQTVDQVSALLTNLNQHEQGRAILSNMALSKFELATNQTFQPIREFVLRFSQQVRVID